VFLDSFFFTMIVFLLALLEGEISGILFDELVVLTVILLLCVGSVTVKGEIQDAGSFILLLTIT
jgi:hypothetical protein